MTPPRVRFAPSPTGHLHVGGARTALFNWLFARARDGAFLLRIEDTDRERSSPAMTRAILEALEWLGLDVDEDVVHQADGADRHRAAAQRLLESGAAYRCFCSEGAVAGEGEDDGSADGEEAAERPAHSGCVGGCARLEPEAARERAAEGDLFAIRFEVPDEEIGWDDAVHGTTEFPAGSVEDFVLLRSDGTPVYNLAVVCDDIEMDITHVIRGDDHLSNTPKQILIYRALGAELPIFGHVPMILGPDGKRLSKRHGAASVEAYRDEGILPEAMVNFLALLGWSPGTDREIMTREELIEAFSLDRILKKSGVFDPDKLRWLNGQHLSAAEPGRLADLVSDRLASRGVDPARLEKDRDRLVRVVEAVKERARTVDELARQAAPFFADEIEYDPEAVERFWEEPEAAAERLEALAELFGEVESWDAETLEEALRGLADERDEGAGKLIHPLRVALMGVGVSPGIFRVLTLMGRERTLARIEEAVAHLRERASV